MGILKKLFGGRGDGNIRLVSVVKKLDCGDDGIFARIQNDLGSYIAEVGEKEDALRQMAYAYARRVSGAGLFLQGIWSREDYAYIFTMFSKFQQTTQQSKNIESGSQQCINFQNEAAKQAAELLQSYNSRFTFDFIGTVLSLVEVRNVPNPDPYVPDEFVIDLIEKIIEKGM